MKTLEKVFLRNYRSHANSTVVFGPLTSIIGENDQGKSNVYRGLEMVLLNQPFSEAQLRYGTKEGSVIVHFTDGTWIERTRRGSKQTCTIFDGERRVVYETVKDITDIVQDFTGFRPVVIDKNSRAESVQLIPIDAGQTFLITGVSADGVLRRVNRLMSGSGVETARLALEKELRVLKSTNASQTQDLEKQERTVEALNAPVWTEVRGELQAAEAKLSLLDRLEEAEATLVEYADTAEVARHVEAARQAFDRADLTAIYALKNRMAEIREKERLAASLATWRDAAISALAVLHEAYSREDEVTEALEALKPSLDAARKADFERRQAEEMQRKKVCPTCKRPL